MTGLIHRFSCPFDSDAVVEGMLQSSNWPRAGYLKSYIHPETFAQLSAQEEAAELVRLLSSRRSRPEDLCEVAQAIKKSRPDMRNLINEIAMNSDFGSSRASPSLSVLVTGPSGAAAHCALDPSRGSCSSTPRTCLAWG